MPNYKVFQDLPRQLRTRVYGYDGSDDVPVVVNSGGVLAVQDNGGSLTVDATDLDIRGLTSATDSILIYGYDGSSNQVILTDSSGRLQTVTFPDFTEASQSVSTATDYAYSTARNVSEHATYSFFVQNTHADNGATVKLEISPDDSTYVLEGAEVAVAAQSSVILQPDRFLKWSHIGYKSTTAGSDASLTIIWQAITV